MIVTCPSCATKFEVPDDKYRPGRKARCSNCGFIFPLPELGPDGNPLEPDGKDAWAAPPAPGPVPGRDAAASGSAPGSTGPGTAAARYAATESFGLDALHELDALVETRGPGEADWPGDPDDSGGSGDPGDLDGQDALDEDAFSAAPVVPVDVSGSGAAGDVVLPPSGPGKKKRPAKRTLVFALVAVLVLGLLGYGGYMVYSAFFAHPGGGPERLTDGALTRSLSGRPPGPVSEQEAARQAAVRRLALEGVRQYTVTDNEKTGPMIVIEGSVVNNFDSPRDLVLLEVTLYDDKGKALVMREQYGGITLSLLQLRTLTKAALEAALANQVNILSNNTNTPPGGRVPFTTVFFDLPKAAYEFEVRIVDVQDPARNK